MKKTLLIIIFVLLLLGTAQAEESVEAESRPDDAVEIMEDLDTSVRETRVYTSSAETLAGGYIESLLPRKRGILRISRPSGLIQFAKGSERRNLYLELEKKITGLAAGNPASSVFTLQAKDLFPAAFTAEDLGVESLFTADGKVTAETANALWEKFMDLATAGFNAVYYCLLEDFPYDFYWMDITRSPVRKTPQISYSRYPGDDTRVLLRGSWTVSFPISRDYAEIPADWDGSSILTEMDAARYGNVTRAKENIDQILSEDSSTTDWERMKYYRDCIRNLSTYHSGAGDAYDAGEIGYGDPWQLIWVFDGDPETRVVCEGFSKAFNYLCDLGTKEATSILVRGTMQVENGAQEAHMWNVVAIDGHNYLVDVTNDSSRYDLFLAGAADGTLADGYTVMRGTSRWTYRIDRDETPREARELELAGYSYAQWREAAESAPVVAVSSEKTYEGYRVAVSVASANGVLPVDTVELITEDGTESLTPEDGVVLLSLTEDETLRFRAVMDGRTTPESAPVTIRVEAAPGSVFALPAGARIEYESFIGTGAELILVTDNEIVPGAFETDVILAVEEAGDWFGSGYSFVVR